MRQKREDFLGATCVVTGGASGIGASICQAFAEQGAHVVVLDLDPDRATILAQTLPRATAYGCDVSNDKQVEATFAAIAAARPSIDILVNNAGYIEDEGYQAMLARRSALMARGSKQGAEPLNATVGMTTDMWRRMLSVHLDGTFFCTRAALREMQRQRRGAIVNMSSVIGLDGGEGIPHYAAAKAGILGLTRAVAREVAPLGIRVNAVAPGFVDTGMRNLLPPEIVEKQIQSTPMQRLGQPDEIAAAVLFLASLDASFVTGQVLSINGGYLAR